MKKYFLLLAMLMFLGCFGCGEDMAEVDIVGRYNLPLPYGYLSEEDMEIFTQHRDFISIGGSKWYTLYRYNPIIGAVVEYKGDEGYLCTPFMSKEGHIMVQKGMEETASRRTIERVIEHYAKH